MMTPHEQFQALNVLELLSDLFSAGDKGVFTREEVLIVIDSVRNDPDFFDPDVLIAQQQVSASIVREF